jgi:hypothetical protein
MALFEIKSTCPSDFPKKHYIMLFAIMNFVPNFMFTMFNLIMYTNNNRRHYPGYAFITTTILKVINNYIQ